MECKKTLGQFYTTNYEYILKNMKIPKNVKTILEPFCGNCDLLKFIENIELYDIELYDIDPCKKVVENNSHKINYNVIKRDTLKNPVCYNDKFVLTNPPYLARNKNSDKSLYDKYKCNDLYKCFILNLIKCDRCLGGIIIIPLNFISSIRKSDIKLRTNFLEIYDIQIINIFEERVFNDTNYSVCCISFTNKYDNHNLQRNIKKTNIHIYPKNNLLQFTFSSENNYTIGGELYNIPQNKKYTVKRATKNTTCKDGFITNILLKCIDDNINNKLGFYIVEDKNRYIDKTEKLSARSYATLVVNNKFTLEQQTYLVQKSNNYINTNREKYNSLFIPNYRESNSIARKRISFDFAFKIFNYIISSNFD